MTLALLTTATAAFAASPSVQTPVPAVSDSPSPVASATADPVGPGPIDHSAMPNASVPVVPLLTPNAVASSTAAPIDGATPLITASPVLTPVPTAVPTIKPKATSSPVADILQSTVIHRKTLANGLRVVVVEDHSAPVVQTAMWYRFGALDEVTGKTGLAHGLEHMMFRGTPSLSEGGIDDIAAREGAQINANTSNDYTHFYFVMPSSRTDLAIRIEADRMRNLFLRDSDWQLEKLAVLNEYDGDLGVPTTLLYNDVCLRATPTPLCGLGALGVRADIVRSHASDLRAYYDRYYHPNNATLVVVGDVKPNEVFAFAKTAFSPLPSRNVHRAAHSAAKLAMNQHLLEHGDTPYATIDIAYPSVGDLDPRAGAAAVLDGVLSNPRSALYEALVVSGISLGYETSLSSTLSGGLEHIFITVAPGHSPEEVERVFHTTIADMLKQGISSSLVDAAKRAAYVNAVSSRDAIDSLGDRVGYAIGVEMRDPSVDDALVANTTTASVNALATQLLKEPSVTGVLLPKRPVPGEAFGGGGSVADNFAGRAPSGPVVEAPWIKALIEKPLKISSLIHPTEFTLSNGLHVLVQPEHGNPTVFINGQIEGSPILEPTGKDGLRDMTSELLSYGGQRYDFEAQHQLADQLGAGLSFGESFSAHGLSRDLPTLLDALADGELHPTFPAKYVDLVRDQTLAEIDARDRDPDSLASRRLALLLLPPNDPELRRATRDSIGRIVRADFPKYAAHAFRPDLTTITVVGDVTPDQVHDEIERTFGSWTAKGPKPDLATHGIPLPHAASAHVLATRRLVNVTMVQPSISRTSRDFVAMNLLNAMLGGGGSFDTRLMHELRERRGLVYSASSGLEVGKYRGLFVIDLSTQAKNVKEAERLARAQIHSFLESPPSQAELDRARERLVAGSLVAEQATDVIASHVATIGHFDLPADYYQNLWKTYEKITPQDILSVARRQLHPNNLVIVTEGPTFSK